MFSLKAKENLGMVMVFAIVSSTQEWINQKWDVVLENKQNLIFIEKKEQEDAEKVFFYFTFTLSCPSIRIEVLEKNEYLLGHSELDISKGTAIFSGRSSFRKANNF